MAPVKPMGVEHHDSNPKTKPGVTGFVQEYNQEPGPQSDLNPDVVSDASVLPKPARTTEAAVAKTSAPRVSKRSKK
jgi:hypothetical protein